MIKSSGWENCAAFRVGSIPQSERSSQLPIGVIPTIQIGHHTGRASNHSVRPFDLASVERAFYLMRDARRNKGFAMNLETWNATINQIIAESNHEPKEAGKQRVLNVWRAKLAKEPTSLPSFRIDQIVREVRKWLPSGSR